MVVKNLGTGRELERKTKHLRPHSHVIMIVLNHTPLSSLQNIINYPYSLTERALEIQRGGGVLLRNLLGIPWRRGVTKLQIHSWGSTLIGNVIVNLTLISTSIFFCSQNIMSGASCSYMYYMSVLISNTIDCTPPDKPSLRHHCQPPV